MRVIEFLIILLSRIVYSLMYTLSVLCSVVNSVLMLPVGIISFILNSESIYERYIDWSDYDFGFLADWGYYASCWLKSKIGK